MFVRAFVCILAKVGSLILISIFHFSCVSIAVQLHSICALLSSLINWSRHEKHSKNVCSLCSVPRQYSLKTLQKKNIKFKLVFLTCAQIASKVQFRHTEKKILYKKKKKKNRTGNNNSTWLFNILKLINLNIIFEKQKQYFKKYSINVRERERE